MRKILLSLLILFLLGLPTLGREYCRSLEGWQGYFAERLNILDPIEGIYDIQRKIGLNNVPFYPSDYHIVIARISGNLFKAFSASGKHLNVYFEKVGHTNYYYLTDFDLNIRERFYLKESGEFTVVSENVQFYDQIRSVELSGIRIFPDEYTRQANPNITSWMGSSFSLGMGYIATNYHVAGKANLIKIFDNIKQKYFHAKLIASDSRNDLAIMKVDDPDFSGNNSIPYALDETLQDVASECFILGYPKPTMLGHEIKYNDGTISAWSGFEGNVSTYQISAPATGGNSGGPTFNTKGDVIGILSSGVPSLENVSYSIKASYLIDLIRNNSLDFLLNSKNSIETSDMTSMVKTLKGYVYFVQCTSCSDWEEQEATVNESPYRWALPPQITKKVVVQEENTDDKDEAQKRLNEIRSAPSGILGELNLIAWKNIQMSMVFNDYVLDTYCKSAPSLTESTLASTYLPLIVNNFNEKMAKYKLNMSMSLDPSHNSGVRGVWEILKVDDDGETYGILSIYEGNECQVQIYINGDGGNGGSLADRSKESVINSSIKLAKHIYKLSRE